MPEGSGTVVQDSGNDPASNDNQGFSQWLQANSSGLLSAGSGIIGSLLNWLYARNLQSRQHDFNMQDWAANNEYNLPENQYQRLIDAGVSPAAAAQGLTGIKDASLPAGTSAPAAAAVLPDLGQSHQIDRSYMLSKSEAESRIALNKAYEDFYNGQTLINDELRPYMKAKIDSEVRENNSKVFANEALARNYDAITKRIDVLTPAELELFKSKKQECLAKVNELNELSKVHQADVELKGSEAGYYDALKGKTLEESKSAYFKAKLDQWKDLYRQLTGSNPDDPPILQWLERCATGDETSIDLWDALEEFYTEGLDKLKKHPNLAAYAGFKLAEHEVNDILDILKKRADLSSTQLQGIEQALKMASSFVGMVPSAPIGF